MATEEQSPLPPLPKPKYGLLKSQPLNYQKVSNPSTDDINSQEGRDRSSSNTARSEEESEKQCKAAQKVKPAQQSTAPTASASGNQERYQPAQGQSRLGKQLIKDTQTGEYRETRDYVDVPQASRRQGLYIIGATGTGKSGLIENLIVQDIKQGYGVCVLDPHGDLIKAVLERMDRREDDVIFLDITDYHYPFGINLFTCSDPTNPLKVQEIVEQVTHIFEKLLGVSTNTPLILEYLLKCTQTLIANPGYTMAEIPLLLQDEQCRKRLVAHVSDIDVTMFWKRFEGKRPSDREDEAAGVLRRVSEFLQPLTRNLVGQSTSTIDLQRIMDEGKILLVKLSAQYQSISNLVGSTLIALILNAMYARPANKRRQFNLYADEFQRFATEDFATLLTEARKFGIATTIAHQARFQPGMTDGIRATTLGAANLVVFRVQPEDASELAGRFDITPQEAWEEELEEEWVEVLKEEWTEKVEDEVIDGEEPVQVYKGDVVDHLLKQGHEDERVMQFVRTHLQPLSLTAASGGNSVYYAAPKAKRVLLDLNAWLYKGMTHENNLFQSLPLRELFEREIGTTPFYDFWWRFNVTDRIVDGKRIEIVKPATEKMLAEYARVTQQLKDAALTVLPKDAEAFHALRQSIFSQSQFPQLYHDALEKRSLYEAKEEFHNDLHHREIKGENNLWVPVGRIINHRLPHRIINGVREEELNMTPSEYEQAIARHQQEIKNAIEGGYRGFDRFAESAQLCQYALCQNPFMTMDSGLYQPRKRTQVHYLTHPRQTLTHPRIAITHPQRTYADMLNEVASQIANLPVYTAKVKITVDEREDEHTIKTLDPKQEPGKPLFGQALQDRIARIQAHNRTPSTPGSLPYCRSRQEVEAEIRQRQERCTEPPPDEPPVTRRK